MNAEQNYSLLQGIDANRRFLLQAYRDNPDLLARAEPFVRRLFDATWESPPKAAQTAVPDSVCREIRFAGRQAPTPDAAS